MPPVRAIRSGKRKLRKSAASEEARAFRQAMAGMARDPEIRKVNAAIAREFAGVETDWRCKLTK